MQPVSFLFCRYEFTRRDRFLTAKDQLQCLDELRGQFFPHEGHGIRESHLDSVIMMPDEFKVGDYTVLAWKVGRSLPEKPVADYNQDQDVVTRGYAQSGGIEYADFVAVPDLHALAVDDRSHGYFLGAKPALRRMTSIVRNLNDVSFKPDFTAESNDIEAALEKWDVNEINFTARSVNPTAGVIGKLLSDSFTKDGIDKLYGTAKSTDGSPINPTDDGFVRGLIDLDEANYAQLGLKGSTPEGYSASMAKPKFEYDKTKNAKHAAKPREIKVAVPKNPNGEVDMKLVAEALIGYYGKQ